jgi:hypothetical protein
MVLPAGREGDPLSLLAATPPIPLHGQPPELSAYRHDRALDPCWETRQHALDLRTDGYTET